MATYSHYDKISINSCKEKCVLGCSGYKNMNLIYPSKLVNMKPVLKSKDLFKHVPCVYYSNFVTNYLFSSILSLEQQDTYSRFFNAIRPLLTDFSGPG